MGEVKRYEPTLKSTGAGTLVPAMTKWGEGAWHRHDDCEKATALERSELAKADARQAATEETVENLAAEVTRLTKRLEISEGAAAVAVEACGKAEAALMEKEREIEADLGVTLFPLSDMENALERADKAEAERDTARAEIADAKTEGGYLYLKARVRDLEEHLRFIGCQPCDNAPANSSEYVPCAETGDCITEFCLPCYAAAVVSPEDDEETTLTPDRTPESGPAETTAAPIDDPNVPLPLERPEPDREPDAIEVAIIEASEPTEDADAGEGEGGERCEHHKRGEACVCPGFAPKESEPATEDGEQCRHGAWTGVRRWSYFGVPGGPCSGCGETIPGEPTKEHHE